MSAEEVKIDVASAVAKSCLGLPYIWGGQSPALGYDCSGFIVELLRATGVVRNKEDLNSQGIYNHLAQSKKVRTHVINGQEGSLIFYGQSPSAISHVAYAIGKGFVIEAGGGDSKTTTVAQAITQQAHVRIRPVYYRSDVVAEGFPFKD